MTDIDVNGGTWTWADDGIRVEASDPRYEGGDVRARVDVLRGDELVTRDRVRLTTRRGRSSFAAHLEEIGVDVPGRVLVALEEAIRRSPNGDGGNDPDMGEAEPEIVKRAEALLCGEPDPVTEGHDTLLDAAYDTMTDRGLVGEETNAKAAFLSAVGGHLGHPIPLVVHGESSGGKNELVRRSTELLPEDRVHQYSGISKHGLEYLGGRIEGAMILDEAEGQEDAEYQIRQAMSEGGVTRLTVNKSDSGRNEAEELEVVVDASIITTTTSPALHPENQTRVLDLWIDDSADQTAKVTRRKAREAAGLEERASSEKVEVWRTALSRLERGGVVIPYAPALDEAFPDTPVRARRDFPKILALIRAHTLLHQHQRERTRDGKLVAARSDYAAVRPLVQTILGPSMTGLSDTALKLAELHEELAEEAKWVRRKDLEELAGREDVASANTVQKWAKVLTQKGYWEGEKRGRYNAWHHTQRRDPSREPIPLPEPAEIEIPSQTPVGRRLDQEHKDPETPPNSTQTGGGRRLSEDHRDPETPPNETEDEAGEGVRI